MLDVDLFKPYNDRYGHIDGDICLRRVADAVKGVINRPGDLAARYGGEEFIVVLPDTDSGGATVMAERMRRAVEALRIPHGDAMFRLLLPSAWGPSPPFPMLGAIRAICCSWRTSACMKPSVRGAIA